MIIEQCLMRAGKTYGGLINIIHIIQQGPSGCFLLIFLHSIQILTNTNTGTWSEQHKELSQSRRK